ncbi:hypothetical protein JD79_01615 [Geodermatophilus normandii]|uniref:Uncharacterized protein n=1 Tax=Geodermatophilus normandii TaxID=1137989 RepID=A0A317QGR6_9ACTN|nr:hypothetical protein [Geodermatophilus normandii]PWW22462.1 hypothetical protein JD79_01615 [Geodermatophilus normandii]
MADETRTAHRPLLCRIGLHAYVQRRPDDERLRGPDHKVCRRCGKRSDIVNTIVPPGVAG